MGDASLFESREAQEKAKLGLQSIWKRIDVSTFPIPIEFVVGEDDCCLIASVKSRDYATGHGRAGRSQRADDRDPREDRDGLMRFSLSLKAPPSDLSEDRLLRWIFCRLQRIVLHELAENFYFDGRRVFDPHKSVSGLSS